MSEGVSEVSERTSEQCERTSERTSEWPSTLHASIPYNHSALTGDVRHEEGAKTGGTHDPRADERHRLTTETIALRSHEDVAQ